MLGLEANRAVSADHLIEGLWGEHPPASVAAAVQTLVYRLRRSLSAAGIPESAGLRAFNANCTGFNHENTGLFAEAASCKK